ncbi:copper chaperone PCu(A)C [Alteromonas gracilis]|uniref:copper chaperone PCu(A)C n=1 Tax=Alteromonas gracilis TaxID=1479524 RepID=UPI00373520D4
MSPLSKTLKSLVIATGLFALGLSAFPQAYAHQHKHHEANEQADVMVMNAYARATFAMAKTGAVYFTLHNQSDSDKTLTSVSVSQDIASEAQIHTTEMEGDVMKMRELTDGVAITAGEMVSFESGGYHVMLLGLAKGLEEGSEFTLTLSFDDNSQLKVRLPVKKDQAKSHHHHHHE